eukprot:GGOE01000789.1.p1 GENE.GGOE01000789.1~~GGOE01000789.1.p1  ORF type:complete len:486 (-),score=147.13 GGOE01000789.1:152-1561(-)
MVPPLRWLLLASAVLLCCLPGVEASFFFPKLNPKTASKHWALLIAGSRGWANYRHQADIYHAYHLVRDGGVPLEHIIVMVADDIANNPENPKPGTVINRPGGRDVYTGVVKDYTGAEVTAANFLSVIAGDAKGMQGVGSGKVLATGPEDIVFIYFSDHGGVLSLGMPTEPHLQAADLVATLVAKAQQKGFLRMTIYVEACYSGSVFQGLLPNNLNIYVTTAANAEESSYATYCPPNSPYTTCLGDLYSVAFMENEDIVDKRETLQAQYEVVRRRASVNNTYDGGSHVMQYGTSNMATHAVGEFMGSLDERLQATKEELKKKPTLSSPTAAHPANTNVRQQDADLLHFFHKYLNAAGDDRFASLRRLHAEVGLRIWLEDTLNEVATALVGPERTAEVMLKAPARTPAVADVTCFSRAMGAWYRHCGDLTQYGLQFTQTFANLCNAGVAEDQVAHTLESVCRRALRLRPVV